jgi:hypothetical protein
VLSRKLGPQLARERQRRRRRTVQDLHEVLQRDLGQPAVAPCADRLRARLAGEQGDLADDRAAPVGAHDGRHRALGDDVQAPGDDHEGRLAAVALAKEPLPAAELAHDDVRGQPSTSSGSSLSSGTLRSSPAATLIGHARTDGHAGPRTPS